MLSLRAHLLITGGIAAAIIVLATVGNVLQANGALPQSDELKLASIAVFFGLCAALAFSAIPMMVKLVIGAQRGIGNADRPAIAALIANERAIVYALWALIALGLALAVPAAILDGAFD